MIIRYRTFEKLKTIPNTKPVIIALQNATMTKRPSALMVIWRMMIRYVLTAQVKMNEKINDPPIHTAKGLSANKLFTVMRFTRKSIRSDASIDTNISMQKTILVLRYLLRNLFRCLVIDVIVFPISLKFQHSPAGHMSKPLPACRGSRP